jgi:hypothetical protein
MPWPVIFRQQNILTRQERAIGIELMVSALAAQVGVLITSAQDQTANALVAHYLHTNMPQSGVNIRVLWTVLTILIFFCLLIRLFGYEESGDLKEDWGVTVPKAAGILLIVFVYLLSPAASANLPPTQS